MTISKIILTGPECSGKTWLAKKLAYQLDFQYFPEYAVEYLERKNGEYDIEDLSKIATAQENQRAVSRTSTSIYDTGALVLKIWAMVKFREQPIAIKAYLEREKENAIYLLCRPDIPWQQDEHGQRENPDDREDLFDLYHEELTRMNVPFFVIEGKGRLNLSMARIKSLDK